jgi:hypothetical protein
MKNKGTGRTTMTNEDQAHAVLIAAANWLAQIMDNNSDDFSGNSPGEGVSVVIADMDSQHPRVELTSLVSSWPTRS